MNTSQTIQHPRKTLKGQARLRELKEEEVFCNFLT